MCGDVVWVKRAKVVGYLHWVEWVGRVCEYLCICWCFFHM